MNNAILLEFEDYQMSAIVKDYSKKEVINGISRLLKIDVKYISELSSSLSYGIFAIDEKIEFNKVYRGIAKELKFIEPLTSKEQPFVFEVKYIKSI